MIWLNRPSGRRLSQKGAVLKKGRDVIKTVTFSHYGNPTDGEVRNRDLRFRTIDIRGGRTVDFDDDTADKNAWYCENDEIEKLLGFLHNEVARTGRYQIVDADSPSVALVDLLRGSDIDPQAIVDALVRHSNIEQIVSLIASSDIGISAAQSAVIDNRRKLVSQLRELIDNPSSTETDVQNLIGNAYWIFGGRYVGVAKHRSLAKLDQTDIPLLGADGTLHVVELKGPCIKKLITRHRNHWIVGPEVHEATAQAMNYLRGLDEQGATLSTIYSRELGQEYDMSRVFATVVIGHSNHHRPPDAKREDVTRTLRQYTAGLNRIEVITYDQLVDSAERSLIFEHDQNEAFANMNDQNPRAE
ncbi:Shedu anti-phage system protein SduA domain-containing protein [Nocardia barduliensis]|uniref:Shedu anti-phage system protein SduA domain-containing protein n=1 Tax=Nocardia barduliensis TaxID=2736643 RepID=UPI0015729954|nr:Shedu anti-phage system protein SduA domain-containing protein [Nocardia barduliensis]